MHGNQVKVKVHVKSNIYSNQIIVMIPTAPILVATAVASNTILPTLAFLSLALGLAGAFEKSLPASVAVQTSSLPYADGDILRNVGS